MGLRTALQQSKILTFAVIAVFVWLLLGLYRIATTFDWFAISTADFIGRHVLGGVVGVIALLILLGVLTLLFAELSESEPTPETWPPAE